MLSILDIIGLFVVFYIMYNTFFFSIDNDRENNVYDSFSKFKENINPNISFSENDDIITDDNDDIITLYHGNIID